MTDPAADSDSADPAGRAASIRCATSTDRHIVRAPIDESDDPLARFVHDAAEGRFPPADGSITVLPADRVTGLHAVLAFTAHAVVVSDLGRDAVLATGIDAYGGATDPAVLLALAGRDRCCGVLDVALARRGTGLGATTLEPTTELDDHPRVRYARTLRRDVTVWADRTGLVALGRGLGGRWELGFELTGERPGTGHGGALLEQALGLVPSDEHLFAACAPGNARSLKVLLTAGFVPFGSEVILTPSTNP